MITTYDAHATTKCRRRVVGNAFVGAISPIMVDKRDMQAHTISTAPSRLLLLYYTVPENIDTAAGNITLYLSKYMSASLLTAS